MSPAPDTKDSQVDQLLRKIHLDRQLQDSILGGVRQRVGGVAYQALVQADFRVFKQPAK